MTTTDKNRIIAQFMGLRPKLESPDVYSFSDSPYFVTRGSDPEKIMDDIASYAKYHSDWNWLMLCVGKIESLGVSVNIKATWNNFHNCTYTQTSIKMEKGDFGHSKQCFWVHDVVYHSHSDTEIKKIDSVHEAVYQFVVWHNQQVNQTPKP